MRCVWRFVKVGKGQGSGAVDSRGIKEKVPVNLSSLALALVNFLKKTP